MKKSISSTKGDASSKEKRETLGGVKVGVSNRKKGASSKGRDLRPADLILQGMAVFTGVLMGVIISYVLRDGGFSVKRSISWYMGREWWSAAVFLLCNIVVVTEMWRYVQKVWKEHGKLWLGIMIIMMVCFVGLSFCPLGLFDEVKGNYGIISVLHQLFARGMFMAMAVASLIKGVKMFKVKRNAAILCFGFVAIAVILGVMSATTQVFWDLNFILETSYIYLFMITLML